MDGLREWPKRIGSAVWGMLSSSQSPSIWEDCYEEMVVGKPARVADGVVAQSAPEKRTLAMTLQAVEPVRMTIDPRRYTWCTTPDLPNWCSIPGCSSTFKLQKHHIVRRSATGGPLDYITIDGLVVQNVCMLCREHHQQITGGVGGHKLWIAWDSGKWRIYQPGDGAWVWTGDLRMGNRE